MARTAVAVTKITRAGVAPVTFASSDVANGNYVPNTGDTWVEVSNTDSVSRNVTITPTRSVDGIATPGVVHAVAAGAQLRLGPFPLSDYSDQVSVDCSAALLKIAAYQL